MREMEKLLSSLVETIQAAKHARDQASRAKIRPRTVDTKANREALIAAIDAKNKSALKTLIDIGVPLATEHNGAPLLALCSARQWTEGFSLLMEAGAPHAWELPAGSDRLPGRVRWGHARSLFEAMAEDDFLFGVEAMWHLATPEQEKAGLALLCSFEAWELLKKHGMEDKMGQEKLFDIASDLLWECAPVSTPKRFQFLKVQAASNWTMSQRAQLWLSVLRRDAPSLTQFASLSGIPPNPDGSLLISPSTLLDISKVFRHQSYRPWFDVSNRHSAKSTPEGEQDRVFTLAELVCTVAAGMKRENLQALIELPEFIEQIRQSPFALHSIAQADASLEFYKDLARSGLDLSILIDSAGHNPLHRSVRGNDSKSNIQKMAALCESWIHQRDTKGRLPVDLADDSNKAALAVVFDKIGMREALGKKRGTKDKPKPRRL